MRWLLAGCVAVTALGLSTYVEWNWRSIWFFVVVTVWAIYGAWSQDDV